MRPILVTLICLLFVQTAFPLTHGRSIQAPPDSRFVGRDTTLPEKSVPAKKDRSKSQAITAFVFSILIPPLGFVLSLIALKKLKHKPGAARNWAKAGMIVGLILTSLIVMGILTEPLLELMFGMK